MTLREYDPGAHNAKLKRCFDSWGVDNSVLGSLPKLGFVCEDDTGVIAAAFLRMVEGNCALFDGLVTDRARGSLERNEAIEIVVQAVIRCAKELKLEKLIAYSVDAGTIERSRSHGFIVLPHTLIALAL